MKPLADWRRQTSLALGFPCLLALLQQQLLLRQPPHLEHLGNAAASAGPAALDVSFSRPMRRAAVAAASHLSPPLRHRWLGEGERLQLSIAPQQPIAGAMELRLAGVDQRGQALAAQRWYWDPRPRVLAVVPRQGGERLELRDHNGHWRPISPVWPRITALTPLGDGRAVALVSRAANGGFQIWRLPLRQRNLWRQTTRDAMEPMAGRPEALGAGNLWFASLSSNRRGELLVQSGDGRPGAGSSQLRRPDGRVLPLAIEASGAMQLLPEGGAVVVAGSEGLSLQTLPPRPPRRQLLPGQRDLLGFCPQAGRALLLRHWPDYRRSIERIEPGLAPRQLWLGHQAVLAAACERGGDTIWALLMDGLGAPRLELLALDPNGRVRRRRRLDGWEPEPGTSMQFDPTSGQLLLSLRRLAGDRGTASTGNDTSAEAQPVLIDSGSLQLRPLAKKIRQAVWLPPG